MPPARRRAAFIIPDTAQEKPMEGEIVAVGPGARDEKGNVVPLSVNAGDRILFGKWSGTEIKIDGEDLLIHDRIRHHGRHRRAEHRQEEGSVEPTRRPASPHIRTRNTNMAAKEVRFGATPAPA